MLEKNTKFKFHLCTKVFRVFWSDLFLIAFIDTQIYVLTRESNSEQRSS